jgi:DNA-binding LytR/AlgR family response regulator
LNAILIDDEPPARSYMRRMLEAQNVEVLAEGGTGVEALDLCEALKPDMVFLDIQIPDLTGLQAAAALANFDPSPLLIFVTGYSEHALEAFEHSAFDYLLKPVEPERLSKTLARASRRLAAAPSNRHHVVTIPGSLPAKRLPVRTDYAIKLIRVEDIDFALAREKKVYVHAAGRDQKTYYTLLQLERLLPSEDFVRIHASALVRLSKIEELSFLGNHSYSVTITGGAVMPVGRTYYAGLQRRLGITD